MPSHRGWKLGVTGNTVWLLTAFKVWVNGIHVMWASIDFNIVSTNTADIKVVWAPLEYYRFQLRGDMRSQICWLRWQFMNTLLIIIVLLDVHKEKFYLTVVKQGSIFKRCSILLGCSKFKDFHNLSFFLPNISKSVLSCKFSFHTLIIIVLHITFVKRFIFWRGVSQMCFVTWNWAINVLITIW